MPVSPLKWNPYGTPGVAQLFGLESTAIKRKTDDSEQQSLHDRLDSTAAEFAPKRVCLWPQYDAVNRQAMQVATADHMMTEKAAAHVQEQTRQQSAQYVVNSSIADTVHPNTVSAAQQQPILPLESQPAEFTMDHLDFQSGMVMNINGDDEAADDYTAAYDAMDGEGAVDMSQYGSRVFNKHEQHCFGAEQSPNSGQHRCYCRPAWDNMMDTKSFYSDIY